MVATRLAFVISHSDFVILLHVPLLRLSDDPRGEQVAVVLCHHQSRAGECSRSDDLAGVVHAACHVHRLTRRPAPPG